VVLIGDAAHAMTPSIGEGANHALESAVELIHTLPHSFYSAEWRARVGIPSTGLEVSVDDLSEVFQSFGVMRPPQVRRGLMLSALASRLGYTAEGDADGNSVPLPVRRRSLERRGEHNKVKMAMELQHQQPPALAPQFQLVHRPAFGTLTPAERVESDGVAFAQHVASTAFGEGKLWERSLLEAAQYYSQAGDSGWNEPWPCMTTQMLREATIASQSGSGFRGGDGDPPLSENGEAVNNWVNEWQQQLRSWWLETPFRHGLRSCMGSLSVLLAARLRRLLSLRMHDRDTISAPPPTRSRLVKDDACEWIGASEFKQKLPPFPELPRHHFKTGGIIVVPLPRLLPDMQWLQGLEAHRGKSLVAEKRNCGGRGLRLSSLITMGVSFSGIVLAIVAVSTRILKLGHKKHPDLKRQVGTGASRPRAI
tara:strand:+ start:943 stop:2211 length:1269 start_codon:yes stop_codon:yes gene_type:complete